MGKQKQQVLSHFFSPKPKNPNDPPPQPSPPPKVTATVAFSPSKRPKLSSTPNPSLHQKFLQTLLEPSTPHPPPPPSLTSSNPKLTPLELQVVDLKRLHPDVLLMVEVGYRYRFFGSDAETAARVLGIYAHMDHMFLTASVPTFRLNVHVRRLVNAGYKVGVVKQTETAAIKAHGAHKGGPFGRGLSALYTKATVEAAEGVGGTGEDRESCYLGCVVDEESRGDAGRNEARIGVVAVEVSTGEVVYGEFTDGFMRSGVEGFLVSLSPGELLIGEPMSKQTEKVLLAYAGPASNVRVERVSRDCFKDGGALVEVMSLYEKVDDDTLGDQAEINSEVVEKGNRRLGIEGIMKMPNLAVQALALTLRHLKQFGLERILHLGDSFRPFSSNVEMTLSANALKQLEVLKNNSDGSESGSLLWCMNHTLTIYGSRLLRHWVTHPLCDRNMISARLDAVSEIVESMGPSIACSMIEGGDAEDSDVTILKPEFSCILSSVLTTLRRSPDIQRGITRIFHRTATPSEIAGSIVNNGDQQFIAVVQAILNAGKQLQQIQIEQMGGEKTLGGKMVRAELLRKLVLTTRSPSIIGNAAKLLSTLNKEAADQQDLQNLIAISDDQFPEVAKARKEVQLANEELNSLIKLYRKQLGMRKLEFMSVSGTTHLIELNVDVRVPSTWVKVNSTKKTVRYHPPDVLTALDHLALAKEELAIACRAAWDNFLSGFSIYYAEFQAAVQALASLDCLYSLAVLSRNRNYVRPVFVHDDEPVQLYISSGRHPVLETLQENFVPNDTDLHADREYCQIITGPNMGGKSCYIRQVALIAIMAQVGSYVPASVAKLHVLDGFYTRMGASDSIQQGRSTFLEELSETSHILHHCTERSLVIIDELGRGTSTHDGVAIAYAALHHLLQKRCMVLFVTHYPKIASIRTEFPGSVGAYHVSYLTSERDRGTVDKTSENEDVTYLYKLVPGSSQRSFGFKVAELAQLPSSCIRRAIFMADRLEAVVKRRESDIDGYNSSLNSCEFNDFFTNLNTAVSSDDITKSIQYLNRARSIAQESVSR